MRTFGCRKPVRTNRSGSNRRICPWPTGREVHQKQKPVFIQNTGSLFLDSHYRNQPYQRPFGAEPAHSQDRQLVWGCFLIMSVLVFLLRQWVPSRRLLPAKNQALESVQHSLHQMEPEPAPYKHDHKCQSKRPDLSQRHLPPHFVANRFMKKSVKAASSSSWDT